MQRGEQRADPQLRAYGAGVEGIVSAVARLEWKGRQWLVLAVGSGGVSGRGLMGGLQKLFYLPEPHTDFIYAVIAEELGLIGATLTLLAFVVITWRGLRAAGRPACASALIDRVLGEAGEGR